MLAGWQANPPEKVEAKRKGRPLYPLPKIDVEVKVKKFGWMVVGWQTDPPEEKGVAKLAVKIKYEKPSHGLQWSTNE